MRKNLQKMATSAAQSGLETAGEGAFALGRTAWLLGLGIAATAGETSVEVFDALVAKGRRRRETPVKKAQRALTETGTQMMKFANDASKVAQAQVSELLGQFGLSSRDDVRQLMRRVETLRQKVI
ncbi:MAG: phasin family protein [Thermoanaerobaculia bacterium]|jgi:polyhydroxyalkanoate synthesis regulator phasin|nr:phasin family protein [Thermoanaerobaculia bacterium]MBP9824316.1 phasin family protein [Thermoanaerobaculia bacterium]